MSEASECGGCGEAFPHDQLSCWVGMGDDVYCQGCADACVVDLDAYRPDPHATVPTKMHGVQVVPLSLIADLAEGRIPIAAIRDNEGLVAALAQMAHELVAP